MTALWLALVVFAGIDTGLALILLLWSIGLALARRAPLREIWVIRDGAEKKV